MATEAVSSSIVLQAFEALGGDPTTAVAAAAKYSSVSSWVTSQSAQVGAAGGAAMAIPGVHLVGMAADIAFLMHKLSVCSWGIGELMGCVVLGKSDFANILALWSGAVSLGELDHRAIPKASLEAIVVAGGGTIGGMTAAAIASQMTGQQLAMLGGQVAGSLLAKKAVGRSAGAAGAVVAGRVGGKLGAKAAAKLSAKFSTKLGAKAFAGLIPLVGPAVGAGVNVYLMRKISKSAEAYYGAPAVAS